MLYLSVIIKLNYNFTSKYLKLQKFNIWANDTFYKLITLLTQMKINLKSLNMKIIFTLCIYIVEIKF